MINNNDLMSFRFAFDTIILDTCEFIGMFNNGYQYRLLCHYIAKYFK